MQGTKTTMTPALAKAVLQSILDERKMIEEKSALQIDALRFGARALEKASAGGAGLYRELHIVRYHADNKGGFYLSG